MHDHTLRRTISAIGFAFVMILGCAQISTAQQQIINVPSHDVLEAGKSRVDFYQNFLLWSPSYLGLTAEMQRGIGQNAEMGFGLANVTFSAPHVECLLLALKRLDTLSDTPHYTISEGLTATQPFGGGVQSGLMLYISGGTKIDTTLRLTFGLFAGLGGVTGTGSAAAGLMLGAEYRLAEQITLKADWLSGTSLLGILSIGGEYRIANALSLQLAIQRANASGVGLSVLTGVRYIL